MLRRAMVEHWMKLSDETKEHVKNTLFHRITQEPECATSCVNQPYVIIDLT